MLSDFAIIPSLKCHGRTKAILFLFPLKISSSETIGIELPGVVVPNFIDEMKTSPMDAVLTCSLNELNQIIKKLMNGCKARL